MHDLGRIAYEGYADNRAHKTFNGDDMLSWDTLGQDIQAGWDAAADAVVQYIAAFLTEADPESTDHCA